MGNEIREMEELIAEFNHMAGRQAEIVEVMEKLGRMAEQQVEIADRLNQLKIASKERLQ